MNDRQHRPPGHPHPPQQGWNAPPSAQPQAAPQQQWNTPQHPGAAPAPQQHQSAPQGPHSGAQPQSWQTPPRPHANAQPQPSWQTPPSPHAGAQQQPGLHQNAQAVHMTGLGAATGQAYLAMFTKKPLPMPRLVGLGMMGMACLVAMAQLAMITLRGVYTWEGMLLLFCSGVPGAWLAVMGDPPDPNTGLVSTQRRAGLIASFVIGLVLAFATSTFLVWVVGIEHW